MQREEIVLGRLALLAGIADVPLAEIGDSRYYVRYAQTAAELDAVLALRFGVFNLELGEGLAESYETGRDEDEFDAVCRHLMVIERSSGDVVGTYRLQTSAMAASGRGFYSAMEFDLSSLPPEVLDDSVELGRACIARRHRNTRVLFLLWRGLAAYVAHNRKRYLFGCCSLPGREPAAGVRTAARLRATGAFDPELEAAPRSGFECRAAAGLRVPRRGRPARCAGRAAEAFRALPDVRRQGMRRPGPRPRVRHDRLPRPARRRAHAPGGETDFFRGLRT